MLSRVKRDHVLWDKLYIGYLASAAVANVADVADTFAASNRVNTLSINVASAIVTVVTFVYICTDAINTT